MADPVFTRQGILLDITKDKESEAALQWQLEELAQPSILLHWQRLTPHSLTNSSNK